MGEVKLGHEVLVGMKAAAAAGLVARLLLLNLHLAEGRLLRLLLRLRQAKGQSATWKQEVIIVRRDCAMSSFTASFNDYGFHQLHSAHPPLMRSVVAPLL